MHRSGKPPDATALPVRDRVALEHRILEALPPKPVAVDVDPQSPTVIVVWFAIKRIGRATIGGPGLGLGSTGAIGNLEALAEVAVACTTLPTAEASAASSHATALPTTSFKHFFSTCSMHNQVSASCL